jgi:MFS transporter, ACS family, hexuronate transporter
MVVTSSLPPRSASWKWWITGLLLLATTINYMDRVTLSSASVRITNEFTLDDAHYGHLELAFGWAFAAGSLVFGFLADRWRVFWLYPAVLAAWSFMGMATGWTHDFTGLLICRTLLGFFEAAHWPCALKTTYVLLTEKDRTMGNSVLQSGASIGAVITPQLMKFMLTDDPGSWRFVFTAVGAMGLVWVLLWFVFMRPRELESTPVKSAVNVPETPLINILTSRPFWAVALLIVGAQCVWHINRVWLMKFLQTGRGFDEVTALNFNSMFFIATDVGCILAGVASIWVIRRFGKSAHDARRWVYFGGCVLTSMSVFIPWLDKGWPLLATMLCIAAGALALFPCYYGFVQDLSTEHVGRLTGILSMFVWAVTSPMHSLFGMIADARHSYDLGLVIAGLAPWLGVVALKVLWRRAV